MIKPGEIHVKNNLVLRSLHYPVDPMLEEILDWIALLHGITITEGWRKKRHDNDLHGIIPVRAHDIRSRDYLDPEEVVKQINETYQYDFTRPDKLVCVYHDSGEGIHMHIQVSPNTKRIKE